ncbi:MAG: hypothetical protein Q8P25_03095 [Candidatus Curtissbacteria bacterium]|nr:hypothetical protein [Candidatus Curtissbacteria bacterium]MDZ4209996.1 hypothetical protein [Candidatus Curtissbacteria bacterium]
MHSYGAARQDSDAESLAQAAITAALCSDWQEAVKINEKILRSTKDNVEALNRLARACLCLGELTKATKTYKKVLEVDPYNIIALKNIAKLAKTDGHSTSNGLSKPVGTTPYVNLSQVFLYEPGKTKIVNLLNLAPPSVLASLNCGDQVQINPKNHSITVSGDNGTYLGAFPDDLAHRVLSLISGGNEYEAYVKSAGLKSLTIFIKETQRSEKFANQPSFQTQNSNYVDTDGTA